MNCSEKQQNPITVSFILKMNKFLITTEKSYPISKVRSGCAFLEQCEEIPHIQGVVAAWAQEGLQELSHIEGQEGQ